MGLEPTSPSSTGSCLDHFGLTHQRQATDRIRTGLLLAGNQAFNQLNFSRTNRESTWLESNQLPPVYQTGAHTACRFTS